jgi:hypothetical protein
MEYKLNKPVAGYHLLLMLTHVDGKFGKEEGEIIVHYLSESFPIHPNLDDEIDYLAKLPQEQYEEHFRKAMNDFYEDSTPEERDHFLDFAVQLVKADHVITHKENIYLDMLFNAWAPEYEEEV